MRKLFLILLLCGFSTIYAQLSGTVLLSGQTNHSGIKIRFTAVSGTAVSDSTITDSSGNYSINISGGVYFVQFAYPGYQIVLYNNNQSIVLTNTTTLTSITLQQGNVVFINGNVSGNWTSNNIYMANSDMTIPNGNTLTIQPGTLVKLQGHKLVADGVLKAVGTVNNKITFTTPYVAHAYPFLSGIHLHSTASQVTYCFIENSLYGVLVENASPLISDNEIKSTYIGVQLVNSSSVVRNNIIRDFYETYATGIMSEQTSSVNNPTIECNQIYDGYGRGVKTHHNALIRNNVIYNIKDPMQAYGYGINCGYNSTCLLENNYIHHCWNGIYVGWGSNSTLQNVLITNNSLVSNNIGISLGEIYSKCTIVNNIITASTLAIQQEANATTPNSVDHNLLWNNVSNHSGLPINGITQLVNTNSNGDSIDSYFNLSMDPLFINNTPPFYFSNSPCVNSGNSNYSPNIGCNPSAMCSSMIVGIKETRNYARPRAFPNPFTSAITVTGLKTDKISEARFYDISGKMYVTEFELNLESQLMVKAADLNPGVYFLEILFSNSSREYIRVIKE